MKFTYSKIDEVLLEEINRYREFNQFFHDIMMQVNGDVDKTFAVLENLQKEGIIPKHDLIEFRERLIEEGIINESSIIKSGNKKQKSSYELSKRGKYWMRENSFKELFSHLKSGRSGNHSLNLGGNSIHQNFERGIEKKAYEFGDDLRNLDYTGSLINSIKRAGQLSSDMEYSDLEIYEPEQTTDTAIVLMIDISHSMILYGEDRITPAKELAFSLVHLIKTRFPKDSIRVVLFGDDAVEVPIDKLVEIDVGPFHTNTQMGLSKARSILATMKQANKQILMITDGKPSMIKLTNGKYYKNSFGLDPEIVNRTLSEAILCRKKGIQLTTFMITDDPMLQQFVSQMTRVAKGKAFYSSVNDVGKFVIENFLSNRKKFK